MEQSMAGMTNWVLLRGELKDLPVFSHENHGKRFDRMTLEILRLSGTADLVHVIVDQELLAAADPTAGDMIEVEGQMRSYNNRTGEGRRLIISVYAASILACDGLPENRVYLRGRICREPVYRRTPLGREICDVMLAVERRYGRTDYLPCILWGSLARLAAVQEKGSTLWLWGRLQSRTYVKQLESGSEERMAFEVSAITAGVEEPDYL